MGRRKGEEGIRDEEYAVNRHGNCCDGVPMEFPVFHVSAEHQGMCWVEWEKR